jgi:hypothetical protein
MIQLGSSENGISEMVYVRQKSSSLIELDFSLDTGYSLN